MKDRDLIDRITEMIALKALAIGHPLFNSSDVTNAVEQFATEVIDEIERIGKDKPTKCPYYNPDCPQCEKEKL